MPKLSDTSEFTIPLKNLLGLIAGTAVSVWAYFGIMERLAFVENDIAAMFIEVEENDNWIDNWKPPSSVQENIKRVREIELQLVEMQLKIKILLARK
jgi:hypothetical protein|tara:strand:+ start:45 stop:335 length:291 start_codon:yes stop_codon:yes gene_type:complete